MKKDQLSFLIPNYIYGCNPFDLRSFLGDGSFLENIDSAFPINFLQPITAPPKTPARQQVLDRILDKISEQDLLGKS